MEKKGKTVNNGEGAVLPEALIQHIQSLLTGKEAARTAVLSKSWYQAWLTSTLNIDQRYCFKNLDDQPPEIEFAELARKRMQRYQDMNLKIDRFRLRTTDYSDSCHLLANELIVKALQMGATDLTLDQNCSYKTMGLPREVLESETLLRLSVSGRKIVDGDVRCSMLKSLSLHEVNMSGYFRDITNHDMFRDIVSSCALLEELSLSNCRIKNKIPQFELRKLRRLSLFGTQYDDGLFFSDFASKFPCLKELSLGEFGNCWNIPSLKIASTSLEKVSIVEVGKWTVELDVPNLVKFSYSGRDEVPSVSIKSSRKWESHISLRNTLRRVTQLSFIKLHKLFVQLSPSKIYLSVTNYN